MQLKLLRYINQIKDNFLAVRRSKTSLYCSLERYSLLACKPSRIHASSDLLSIVFRSHIASGHMIYGVWSLRHEQEITRYNGKNAMQKSPFHITKLQYM